MSDGALPAESVPGVSRLRWVLALVTAALLAAAGAALERGFDAGTPPKGSTARFTIRAPHDAVFDLHATHAAEAREARRSYLPIYTKNHLLLYEQKDRIVEAALTRPVSSWDWKPETAAPPDAGMDGPAAAPGSDGRSGEAAARDGGPPTVDARPRVGDARADGEVSRDGGTDAREPRPETTAALAAERRREIKALLYGCFRLLQPFYDDGVIADTEFPNEKRRIRVRARGRYVEQAVAGLHRFSALRPALERRAEQFFFKTEPRVRAQVIEFILDRLPPNLSYAKENQKFISDISHVTGLKVLSIRRGDILVARGRVIDTRAYHAIRASNAADNTNSRASRWLGRTALLSVLLLVFVLAAGELCGAAFSSLKPYLAIFGGIVLLGVGGQLVLCYWPVHATLVPQAAIALVVVVVLGRGAAVIAAIAVAGALAIFWFFDLTTLAVGAAGGVIAALTVRRRRRSGVLAAGILIGIGQALVFVFCRTASGHGLSSASLWTAAQAFGGGLIAGLVAVTALPFVQRWLGQASRGKLRVLSDFDHALARRLRDRRPSVFAHTLRVISLADAAAKEIGADRLLVRAGALFHDLGKMDRPGPEEGQPLLDAARARQAHVARGVELCASHELPAEISSIVAEHHGTTAMVDLAARAEEAGDTASTGLLRFSGPRPQSLESAIVLIADRVERSCPDGCEDPSAGVHRVVVDLLAQFQFAECGVTQRQLRKIEGGMVGYLERRTG